MSNLVMWNLLVGFLLPNLIAVAQQPKWSKNLRAGVTVVFCVIFGAGTAYFNGKLGNLGDVVGSMLTVGVSAITFYQGLWVHSIAPAIENATSPRAGNAGGSHLA